jgi:lysophospholipase
MDTRVKSAYDIPMVNLVSTPDNPCPDGAVTGRVRTPDGVDLRFARWDAPAHSRGTVCVFGGRGEFIEKYFETVRELRQRGFAVATVDWRGQGHSSRQLADPRKGHVWSFAEFEIDVETLMQQVVLANCPPPYFALAHSMGGAALLRVAHSGKRWFDRAVLVSPLIDMPGMRASLLARLLMRALRIAGFGESDLPGSNLDRAKASDFGGNPLTSDPVRYARNAAISVQDPTLGIGPPTVAWLDAAFDTMVAFRAADYPARIDRPVLTLAAGDDSIVSIAAIKAFTASLPAGQHRLIEGARHEILQERDSCRAQFWAAFDGFMAGPSI